MASEPLTQDHIIANAQSKDDHWIYRSLLVLRRAQLSNPKEYRNAMLDDNGDRIENRNSPAYWLEWMTKGVLNRSSQEQEVISYAENHSHPERGLSREHLDNAVALLAHPVVAAYIVKCVTQ